MTTVRFTDDDRRMLAPLTRAWRATPPCFTPNEACRGAVQRGLIEIAGEPGGYRLRLTELGASLKECGGEG